MIGSLSSSSAPSAAPTLVPPAAFSSTDKVTGPLVVNRGAVFVTASSSVTIRITGFGGPVPLPPVTSAETPTKTASGPSTSSSKAVIVTVPEAALSPAAIVSSPVPVTVYASVNGFTVTTVSAVDSKRSPAVTVVSPPSST